MKKGWYNMKKPVQSQSGLTLVEILAAVIILFIISLFIFNIVYSANKHNVEQSAESTQINNAAYLLKQMTKDIRKTNNVTPHTVIDETTYKFENTSPINGTPHVAEYKYDTSEKSIYRNGAVLVNNVENFVLTQNTVDNTVTLKFTINGKDYDTTIALRKGQ